MSGQVNRCGDVSAVASKLPPVIRAMREKDLAAVLAIERRSYEFPWTEGIFRDCLRAGYVCQVYDSHEGVLGYGVMSLGSGECHLLNICIDPRHRTRQLGSSLIHNLLQHARRRGATLALLEVRISNQHAYRLYTRLGFNEIGVRKRYYPALHGREDALVLARDLRVPLVAERR